MKWDDLNNFSEDTMGFNEELFDVEKNAIGQREKLCTKDKTTSKQITELGNRVVSVEQKVNWLLEQEEMERKNLHNFHEACCAEHSEHHKISPIKREDIIKVAQQIFAD